MDNGGTANNLWGVWKKTVYLVIGAIILFWFLATVKVVLVLFLASFIFTLALNPIVTWLEKHRVPRLIGSVFIVVAVLVFIGLLLWLMIPQLINEITGLITQLPSYFSQLSGKFVTPLTNYPGVNKQAVGSITNQIQEQIFSQIQSLITNLGSVIKSVTDSFIFLVTFVGVIIYSLIDPRPILKLYLRLFPPNLQEQAKTAMILGSKTTIGWVWASLIIGIIQGVVAFFFLFFIGIPAAVVWAVLTFISQFVPRYGPYLMTIPPALIALSIDPIKALWVILFYFILNEITEDVFAPYIRAAQMALHPVLIIFAVLVSVYAFGFVGAVIATPLAGFAKAFYEQFYLSQRPKDENINLQVEQILNRRLNL